MCKDKDGAGAGDMRCGSMKLDHGSTGSEERRRREDERGDMKGDGTQREKLGFLKQVELWLQTPTVETVIQGYSGNGS